ncbi:EamA family transporter RarD [Virgibacillus halodenitrificans]|uniref:EamA family transporter RarD n=1 Tax=Virgibacillus halodenitrificans TaxID=1482 RepID=A0ABR7VRQ6_VIRHA|nr:EamA family transporter RarD [Virgibacillus halodenitrificans]MBD1223457.1 EamA family transporter RarD [Virgibacillus halodenitrificans]
MNTNQVRNSIIYAIGAYIIWGFLPIYWKQVESVPAGEILAHRIIWSFVFMLIILLITGKWPAFIKECKSFTKSKKKVIFISLAAIVISLNWLTYIWAVNSDHVIQASLGYYINPLVSILLGIIFLKENMTRRQIFSFILASLGVIYLTISYGVFPWVSLALAFSFGVYGLLKKVVDVGAMTGLTIETFVVTPFALLYLFLLPETTFKWVEVGSETNLLLMGAGIMTAIPLLLFAAGAKHIPLGMIGFLQYFAPTIMLLLGVFLYEETFTSAHLIAFSLIWIALINYMGAAYRPAKTRKNRKLLN